MRYASREQPRGNADQLDGHHATDFELVTDAEENSNHLLMESGDALLTESNYFIIL